MSHFFRITGAKNSGKTTLIEKLTKELIARRFRVGTMKHTSHNHEFDRPGSDSHRHSAAGSTPSMILSPNRLVCHTDLPPKDKLVAIVGQTFSECDIVLCEGFASFSATETPAPMIECVAAGKKPLFPGDPDLVAAVTDETLPVDVPTFRHAATGDLAQWLEETFRLDRGARNSSP